MGQFEREKAFILLVARGTLSEEERIKFEDLLSAELEWDYVLTQLKRHKLFPLFNSHLQSCRTTKNLESVINEVKNNCTEPIKRSRMLDAQLCRIAESLAEKGIAYAVLKGPVLAHAIYNTPDKRTYGDIDILVKKSDTDTVTNILKEHGYIQGQYDKEKAEIVPAPRKDVLWCSMYIHQLYPFQKVVDQCPCTVEVQTGIFPQSGKTVLRPFDIDLSATSEVWQAQGTIQVNGELISTLNWKYFLLQLCLHAYQDEISIARIVYENVPCLRAYCDIQELLTSKRHEINADEFAKLVQRTGTNEPVYYILAHLSKVYVDGLKISSPILEQIRPSDLSFLNQFGRFSEIIDQQRGQFSRPFMERLFDDSCKGDYERQSHLFGNLNRAK